MTVRVEWAFSDPDVSLRLRPLREHWEARGPGLMLTLSKRFPWLAIPQTITVHLQIPQRGGWGQVRSTGEVEFEAVLANPIPNLPEVLRLGWLCLLCSPYAMVENKTPSLPLAFVPPLLMAGQFVELCEYNETTVAFALKHWLQQPTSDAPALPDSARLLDWWTTQESSARSAESWQSAVERLSV